MGLVAHRISVLCMFENDLLKYVFRQAILPMLWNFWLY